MKNKILKILIVFFAGLFVILAGYYFISYRKEVKYETRYLASSIPTQEALNEDGQLESFIRGTEVKLSDETKKIDDVEYKVFYYQDKPYYFDDESILCEDINDVVQEKEMYAYRTSTVYEDEESSRICGLVVKGETINVIGHSTLKEDGTVDRYLCDKGYVLTKYLTNDIEIANEKSEYDRYYEDIYAYDGTISTKLDYYPNEKPIFDNNIMPDIVKALYINNSAIYEIDSYIELAKRIGANAFVIDIKDTGIISLKADVMEKYSPSSYETANHSKETYIEMVNKCKENGIYTIARITTFKDPKYASDHNEEAILNTSENNTLFNYGGAYWPSAYSRECWEYNVELGKECIKDIGFNEIQFDYVRFPELVGYFNDNLQILDLRNKYNESRTEAIQRFLMYACDEIHKVGGYVSADVFGETSNNYICDYGQYWPALSNAVDVISAMPYPDHFNSHDYGIQEYVWQAPYKLLKAWSSQAKERQKYVKYPAKVRTWLQGYDSIKEPYVEYDADKIIEQINGLKDGDLYDGFMIWNAASSYYKYESYERAFK